MTHYFIVYRNRVVFVTVVRGSLHQNVSTLIKMVILNKGFVINFAFFKIIACKCCLLQPPPAPRMRSKIDTLIFTDSVKGKSIDETSTKDGVSFSKPHTNTQSISKDVADKEVEEVPVEVENVERPVDLYKVISSFFLLSSLLVD